MEILKPNELREKFNDPWIAPYEKVLTMVDGDKVEIVEYHPCISGSHWLLNQYRNNSELIDSAYRDGNKHVYKCHVGSAPLDLKASFNAAGIDEIIIDEEAGTVFIQDADMRLDVGAVAKGWAAQKVAEQAPENLLISVGGNVCATGPKDDKGTPWVVGVQDPDKSNEEYLHTIYVSSGSVVTSGDYQRVYVVDGKSYHHIIDPETLYPSEYWRSVTIVCEDSGLADMLSTALFLLPKEEGQKLLDEYDAKALWVDLEGNIFYSPGFKDLIRT